MRPRPRHACVRFKVGDLVSCQPELLRKAGETQYQRDLGMVIGHITDDDSGDLWPVVRWRNGEISMPIPTDLVVISEP